MTGFQFPAKEIYFDLVPSYASTLPQGVTFLKIGYDGRE